jgi:hypothetical protein
MDTDNILWVVCLAVGIAIGIPALLYLSLRRGQDITTIDLMRHAVGRARAPWGKEDEALAELSRRVSKLQEMERGLAAPATEDSPPPVQQNEDT